MLKFSMVLDADARRADLLPLNEGNGALFKLRDDPRITRFGKLLQTSPSMSYRSCLTYWPDRCRLWVRSPRRGLAKMPREASRRSLVTPGLTGLWQVSGRSDLQEDDAIRLDLRYIENWSLTLDLQILWKTIWAVLSPWSSLRVPPCSATDGPQRRPGIPQGPRRPGRTAPICLENTGALDRRSTAPISQFWGSARSPARPSRSACPRARNRAN